MDKKSAQQVASEAALAAKRKRETDPDYLQRQTDTPADGPIKGRNQDEPVSGALDAEGHRPVLERSRKVR